MNSSDNNSSDGYSNTIVDERISAMNKLCNIMRIECVKNREKYEQTRKELISQRQVDNKIIESLRKFYIREVVKNMKLREQSHIYDNEEQINSDFICDLQRENEELKEYRKEKMAELYLENLEMKDMIQKYILNIDETETNDEKITKFREEYTRLF